VSSKIHLQHEEDDHAHIGIAGNIFRMRAKNK